MLVPFPPRRPAARLARPGATPSGAPIPWRRLSGVAALGLALAALPPAAGAVPDLARGRAVVVGAGLPPNVACLACHGLEGVGDGSGAFPRLTGQPAWYLYKQLQDYAGGTRPNDVMTPVAKALSLQQMEDVAAWYATQAAPYAPPPQVDGVTLQHGGRLSAVGDPEKGIPACVTCHGPAGLGMPPAYPWLAGQYAAYTELQLTSWQQGVRRNDPLGVMATVAKAMTPEDIRATALYFESVRPPPAAAAGPGAPAGQ